MSRLALHTCASDGIQPPPMHTCKLAQSFCMTYTRWRVWCFVYLWIFTVLFVGLRALSGCHRVRQNRCDPLHRSRCVQLPDDNMCVRVIFSSSLICSTSANGPRKKCMIRSAMACVRLRGIENAHLAIVWLNSHSTYFLLIGAQNWRLYNKKTTAENGFLVQEMPKAKTFICGGFW